MLTFPRVPLVAPGDAIAAPQLARLADAFNARLRSGLGDPTFRIFFYFFSLFRQMRNPDESGFLFPPNAEFFQVYQMLAPESAQWPAMDAGDPEGANLANPMNAFIFGQDAIGLESEADRLALPLVIDGREPNTPQDAWELGKLQRGGFDPATGAIGSPAYQAAREYYKLITSPKSMFGNSYGGFMPVPELGTDCGDAPLDGSTPSTPNWQLFFTHLPDGAVRTYPGTCPNVAGNVLAVMPTPWAYYVFLVGGSVDVLSTNDWLEGPYSGGAYLRKQAGNHWPRLLQNFAREFRGTANQRLDPNTGQPKQWNQAAVDFQQILTTQWLLAPAQGNQVQDEVMVDYPLFRLPAPADSHAVPAGTELALVQGDKHLAAGCVLAGVLVSGRDALPGVPIGVELLDGDKVQQTVTVRPEADGIFAKIVWFASWAPADLKLRLSGGMAFTAATGKIEVECAKLLACKPQVEDLYLLLRLAAATNATDLDGAGIQEDTAVAIGARYLGNGCLQNGRGQYGLPTNWGAVNTNAVYDAARRLSQCVRVVPRQNLRGYAVENGKSVLWFARYAYGLSHDAPIDLFAGIAPDRLEVTSGAVRAGRAYTVRAGSVLYGSQHVHAGQTFLGDSGVTMFSGDGHVYELEGIWPVAPPGDFTNEWLMGAQFKAYHPSESSLWKPDAYSDYFCLSNRAHFYSAQIGYAPTFDDLRWHFSYGQKPLIAPEAASGYNYAHGTNSSGAVSDATKLAFFKSCQVYAPDAEIDSAQVVFEAGEEVVKLTFAGRLHNTAGEIGGAAASIDRDLSTWTDPNTEPYRTTENGIRAYLWLMGKGVNATPLIGDNALTSTIQTLPDNPYGTCYPHFLFTKLIPAPFDDGTYSQDNRKTPFYHDQFTQMEIYLRAMCEGWMDGKTTGDQGCQCIADPAKVCAIFDYTFENLCFDAFGGRWLNLLPLAIRPDNAAGYGPLPNTLAYADLYNQFAAAVNKLDKVRVMLPYKLETNVTVLTGSREISGLHADGSGGLNCTTSFVAGMAVENAPQAASLVSTSGWVETTGGVIASVDSGVGYAGCSGSNWVLSTTRTNIDYRVNLVNPDALYALPATWRDMFPAQGGLLAQFTRTRQIISGTRVSDASAASECRLASQLPNPGFWDHGDGTYWLFSVVTTFTETTCQLITTGSLVADQPERSYYTMGRNGDYPDAANCFSGPGTTLSMEPQLNEALFVQIPLVDP